MKCPSCNSSVSSKSKSCKYCDANLSVKKESKKNSAFGYLCPICKMPNPKMVDYCVKCGHWLLDTLNQVKPITKKEFKKYFSKQESNSKQSRIGKRISAIIIISLYIFGSADVKLILSLLIGIIGLISIIKPLSFLGIRSRLGGFGLSLFGVILLFVSVRFLPPTNSAFMRLFDNNSRFLFEGSSEQVS